MDSYRKEPNLMQYYFDRDTHTYKIFEQMRRCYLRGQAPKFRDVDVEAAKKEIDKVRSSIDKSTYQFAKDLSYHFFGGVKKQRVLLFVEGTFFGDKSLDSVIGVDLGSDPHELHKGQDLKGTIDAYVTQTKTKEFLAANRTDLVCNNFHAFLIRASKFFYFLDDDLYKFLKDEMIDMVHLIPLVIETKGYVATTQVSIPTFEQYMEESPRFVSQRLKNSLKRKSLKNLNQKVIRQKDIISDWGAHRVETANQEEAKDLHLTIKNTSRENPLLIGQNERSKIVHVFSKDYYESPKGNDYRIYKEVVEVSTSGYRPCVREIQIVEKPRYYGYEIDPSNPAHHSQQVKKARLTREGSSILDPCNGTNCAKVLEEMFGRSEILIPI